MSYVIDIRRKIHTFPEVGFELPRTLKLVKSELENLGVSYTEAYGKSSIVATINEDKSHFTIGIRADMDALPVNEKTGLSFKSKIKGQMHACGHDSHTAILLNTIKKLSEMKDNINCRVKFIFQAGEEVAPSGAKLMTQDGVMDGIDCIIALHCEPSTPTGTILLSDGPQNAISSGFAIDFYGKSAHAANQEDGIDAIWMAHRAYMSLEMILAKEIPARTNCIFNVGSFHGGKSNNIICDHVSMNCTLRTWDEETDSKITKRIKQIITSSAKESGGRATFTQNKYYPIVYNNTDVCNSLKSSAEKILGKGKIFEHKRAMIGEDFAYFAQQKPGCMFFLGVRNEEKDCVYSLHQDKFNIDEDALEIGTDIFVQFVLDNMDGA